MSDAVELQQVTIHGHERAYVKVGSGPALLLLHGLGCDHTTWRPVLARLAERFTVIAPDLLGHGASAKPRADYSLGGYANGVRDLLTVHGIDKVTVVGHSFGGGVAMQFGYQFPERTERMVLVSPGGFGPEVTPAIRALTLPGAHQVIGALTLPGIRHLGIAAMRALARTKVTGLRDLDEVARIYQSFRDPATRAAVRRVTRSVVDLKGQVITMTDRAYLTAAMPTCVVWGANDGVIPVSHSRIASEVAPSARVVVLDDCGHFPHKDHPEAFTELLEDFVTTTAPATYRRNHWRTLLTTGRPGALGSVPDQTGSRAG